MQSRSIPPGFRIWLCSQRGQKWSAGFYRYTGGLGITDSLPPPPPPDPPIKNVQAVTWGISRLLIYSNSVTSERLYPFLALDTGPLVQLWPLLGSDITWPSRFFVEDPFVDGLAEALDGLVMGPSTIRQ